MNDRDYMTLAIELAERGRGLVEPNPLVGAILVANGHIIGRGFHAQYGGPHAEVHAIRSVENKNLLHSATLYVTLEPCSHFGKTPPCADLIIDERIPRVVIGSGDPNPAVNGDGIQKLRKAGIEVIVGIMEQECEELNRRYFTFHRKKRPFVLLKWAQTRRGLIDDQGKRAQISDPRLQMSIHQWRSECDAIMVGRITADRDDPALTVRAFEGKNPRKIIIGDHVNIEGSSKLRNGTDEIWVLNTLKEVCDRRVLFFKIPTLEPKEILRFLYQKGLTSVLVEGGAKVLQAFIDADLWDDARVIIGRPDFTSGTSAPRINKLPIKIEPCEGDEIHYYHNS